jgi:hypothetical protein
MEGQQKLDFAPKLLLPLAEPVQFRSPLRAFKAADGKEDLGQALIPFRGIHAPPSTDKRRSTVIFLRDTTGGTATGQNFS